MQHKIITLLLGLALFLIPIHSLGQFSLGAEIGVGLPFSNLGNQVNAGFGGQLNLDYFIQDNLSIGVGLGYYTFSGSQNVVGFDDFRVNITPVVAQIDYYFVDSGVKPFLGLQVGLYRLANRFDANNFTQVIGENHLGLAPKLGVVANVIQNFNFVGNIKYHYLNSDIDDITFLSIHLGVAYKFAR